MQTPQGASPTGSAEWPASEPDQAKAGQSPEWGEAESEEEVEWQTAPEPPKRKGFWSRKG
jgi:hypothetical protein